MADVSKISPDNGVNIYDLKDTPARNMVTDAFSPSTAYAVGDYCIYDGVLYICTTAHEGTWNASDFTATTIANELKNAGGGGDLLAYQTKNLVTPLTISGVSQTTVEGALDAISKKTSLLVADKNRNLGTSITAAQKLAIARGTFEDLPIGGYWTLNGDVYRIAHHDYFLRTGDTACTSHHIVVVPDYHMGDARTMNSDSVSTGYAGTEMRMSKLTTARSKFITAFGATHILSYRALITNASGTGGTGGYAWYTRDVDLMTENMVFGHPVYGQSVYETGVERGQLALFSLYPEFIQKARDPYWLRSMLSSNTFCAVSASGEPRTSPIYNSLYIRPFACIYFNDVL